jgi:hypothetical protein
MFVYKIILMGASLLISVYFTVYFHVWAYISFVATFLILPPRKITYFLLAVTTLFLVYSGYHWNLWTFMSNMITSGCAGTLVLVPLCTWLLI